MSNLRWKIAQSAEIRWWKKYLKNKDPLTYLDQKAKYWHWVLNEMQVSFKPDDTILDAGCGPAGLFMVTTDYETHAVDPLLQAYQKDIDHFDICNYPHTRFHSQKLETFRSSFLFDTIFCMNAINHVDNIHAGIDALVAALKPGGQLLISTDVHRNNILKKIFQALPGDILHPHQYDINEYKNMLLSRGLVLKIEKILKHEFIFDYVAWVFEKK